jgi:hypothetical protein
MAEPRVHRPVQLIVACFSRHAEALAWVGDELVQRFGPIGLASADFLFNQTSYYEATMGTDLLKRFLVFERLVAANCLPEAKLFTNGLEEVLSGSGRFPEPRPLNLDPGTLELGKFLLATTKDQGHRIYLDRGIFAEVTLRFEAGEYRPWPWTYADYRQECVRAFLKQARELYRQQLAVMEQPTA